MGRTKTKTDPSEAIYLALRHAIIERAIDPGTKLPEDAIAEQFSTSRSIVRNVFGRLRIDGLVEFRHNRGAAVASPKWEEASILFDIRMALERIAIEQLAASITPSQMAKLRAHVREEIEAKDKGDPKSIRLATEFHLLLAEMTGSEVLAQWVTQVSLRCGLILSLYARPHSTECGINEHEQIIAALEKKNAKEASRLLTRHLSSVIERANILKNTRKSRDILDVLDAYSKVS